MNGCSLEPRDKHAYLWQGSTTVSCWSDGGFGTRDVRMYVSPEWLNACGAAAAHVGVNPCVVARAWHWP